MTNEGKQKFAGITEGEKTQRTALCDLFFSRMCLSSISLRFSTLCSLILLFHRYILHGDNCIIFHVSTYTDFSSLSPLPSVFSPFLFDMPSLLITVILHA